jgi:ligand-binding sensor domain-containing protein
MYLGSWEDGLIEILDGAIINEFNEENSTLELGFNMGWLDGGWIGVAGVDFSNDGILWCTNAFTSEALHARDLNGEFHSFDFSPQVVNTDKADGVVVTSNGWVWTIIRGKGLVVLNTNETLGTESDDVYKLLNDEENNGGLPNNEIFCLAEDLDGEVWVGTLQGIAVFYALDDVFSEDGVNAEQILIEQDGNIQILLETETVTAIEVDGGNRKWVGTANSGVFLFSPDGQETIYHFTESNSPLLSNNVLDIDINHGTGEVYFATDAGIVSFQSTATNFVLDIEEVKVYPNPVRPEYEGLITVDGLAYQTDVRITDAAGNLVYNTTSEGGRATWTGLNLNGERVSPGVYLIFCSNPDGSATQVAKVAVVK